MPDISQFVAQEAVHALINIISLEAWMGRLVLSLNDHGVASLSSGMATEPTACCSPPPGADGAADVI